MHICSIAILSCTFGQLGSGAAEYFGRGVSCSKYGLDYDF